MFAVTLLSTVFAVLFAFCGLMGGLAFFLEAEQGMSLSSFLQGFTTATWPLLASCALLLLQALLKEVAALREAQESGQNALPTAAAPPSAPASVSTPQAPAAQSSPAKPAPVYFPVRETPQGPRIVRPAEEAPAEPAAAPAENGLSYFKTR